MDKTQIKEQNPDTRETVLKVEGLSKTYRLGQIGTGTISHDLNRWWAKMRGKEDPFATVGVANDRSQKDGTNEYVKVLDNINFEVKKGEVLGIIGKNGAGKSTLLKVISQITSPTTGSVKAKGRIASLLEVGTGMHPEMTGRENVYLNGTILGMTKKEIDGKFDEIMDFAGCAKYADTPVKRYSSGMKVRLGFAVAAFLEPEILIVDEVLAVGDAEFQKKAIGKMQDISAGGARTVLFVSHNMVSIQSICHKCILLESGKVDFYGEVNKAVEKYLTTNTNLKNNKNIVDARKAIRSAGNEFAIKEVWLENEIGEIISEVKMGDSFLIKFEFECEVAKKNLLFGFGIENESGVRVTSLNNEISGQLYTYEIGKGTAVFKLNKPNFNSGRFYVSVSMVSDNQYVDFIEQVLAFEVVGSDVYKSGKGFNSKQGVMYVEGFVSVC
ncbi:ABC transporter ATP-binding protein [Luteibaculum oceani]|uniref:ABC transporter ATP-binding protein n=1 Tax=Luteibaculum oceani TaxID=1294296 RepID=UPI001CB8EF3F|nr:ABC transporter ATP-binding protein [Luteibaculum oceani]